MAIVKMSEFQLIVMNNSLEKLLLEMQRFENVVFRDQSKEKVEYFHAMGTDYDFERNEYILSRLTEILERVNKFEKKHKKKEKGQFLGNLNVPQLTFDELLERCSNIDIDGLLSDFDWFHEATQHAIDNYELYKPWDKKQLSEQQLLSLSRVKPVLGTVSKENKKQFEVQLQKLDLVFYMHTSYDEESEVYVVCVLPETKNSLDIILDKYHFQKRSASSLGNVEQVQEMHNYFETMITRRKKINKRLENIGNYREELQLYYEYLTNEALRFETKQKFLTSENVTMISGWIFTSSVDAFNELVKKTTDDVYSMKIIDVPKDSKEVPIKLKNNRLFSPFESITSMYSLPVYKEIDPTPLLAPFYAMFFGMMLGDFGYGLIMGVATFGASRALKLKASTMKFITFLMYMSVPTMIWGLIYGSFFGGIVPISGLVDINVDFMYVLVFSILFGIVHIFFGLGIKAYLYIRDGDWLGALFDVGFWYLTLIGAIVLVSQIFTDVLTPYSEIAKWLLIVGMVGIVLTNGRSAKTIGGKAASGFYSLYGLSNYVGDIVSYSRLMALGLAGASIGVAFNMIVEMLSGFGVLGIIPAFLVFLIGHSFNMGISGLSAYVHSARLTFVEFFGKFYTGGGKRFVPFRSKNKYVNINLEDEG